MKPTDMKHIFQLDQHYNAYENLITTSLFLQLQFPQIKLIILIFGYTNFK
jgi:hypothetical protein